MTREEAISLLYEICEEAYTEGFEVPNQGREVAGEILTALSAGEGLRPPTCPCCGNTETERAAWACAQCGYNALAAPAPQEPPAIVKCLWCGEDIDTDDDVSVRHHRVACRSAPPAREETDLRAVLGEGVMLAMQSNDADLIDWAQRIPIEFKDGAPVAAPPAREDNRCARCGWPLGENLESCSRGNCQMRPLPETYYDRERWEREHRPATPASAPEEDQP